MSGAIEIPITTGALQKAASQARHHSSEAVQERVLVSQALVFACRQYIEDQFGISTYDGRSAAQSFTELLDLADFQARQTYIEMRPLLSVANAALVVPTMPLMVGVLSDLYLAARMTNSLDKLELVGFAARPELNRAELTPNGLFAILPAQSLQPPSELQAAILSFAPNERQNGFEVAERQAEKVVAQLSAILKQESALEEGQQSSLLTGMREEMMRIYGEQLCFTGIEALLRRLLHKFNLNLPLPASPEAAIIFQNSGEEKQKFAQPDVRTSFFQDKLSPGERIALYRFLLMNESAMNEHCRLRRVLDIATGGKHQTSSRRQKRLAIHRQKQALSAALDPEPIAEEYLQELAAEVEHSGISNAADAVSASAPFPPVSSSGGPMNIFELRNQLIADYDRYVKSFIQIRSDQIREYVEQEIREGAFYPEPLIQLNPSFAPGGSIEELVAKGILQAECANIFRSGKSDTISSGRGLRLHKHQSEAIYRAREKQNYILTTGTGSGKSLAYIIPIVNHVLQNGAGKGIQAIVVYPMNALANSQYGELMKFLQHGYPPEQPPVRFDKYTGQESKEDRDRILHNPPDILLTNYVMLELILTRPRERKIIEAAQGLKFLVLDELHTYRGRQGADVALLVRRLRDRLNATQLLCIGTSATIAGEGNYAAQQNEVAEVAKQIFGDEVRPENVVTETLRRATPLVDLSNKDFLRTLSERIESQQPFACKYDAFINDPLAMWIESTFGVEPDVDGRLVRCLPLSITGNDGAAKRLSEQTELDPAICAKAIQRGLLAGYECEKNPDTGFSPFAFRLHQFISRGDTVYATLEEEASRYLTIYGQQYKPGSREHLLLPMVFCRECGQEYYSVHRHQTKSDGKNAVRFVPRRLNDQTGDQENEAGFLYLSAENPFPFGEDEIIRSNRIPDDWVEERAGNLRIRKDRKEQIPQPIRLITNGYEDETGLSLSYIPAPFRFCLQCGVSYNQRQKDDFAKLAALGSEGRSTATTIMSLSAIRALRRSSLPETARKLLSFTDNRQDASLQAGHFNDFVETTLLRSALFAAVKDAGQAGISYDELTGKVFDALKLPRHLYAKNPEEKFQSIKDTDRALREVIGYRLYRDLERGWRITMPNLEQCGLLRIEYQSLDELCQAEEMWSECHPALVTAPVPIRQKICQVLLDFMRQELTICVSYLDSREQEKIKQQSTQRLVTPWAIDENEKLDWAGTLFPRSRKTNDPSENTYLSERGGFGQYLRRRNTFEDTSHKLDTADTRQIIVDLLPVLAEAGLLTKIETPDEEGTGYQLMASSMRWVVGDGERAYHNPIRTPNVSDDGNRTNPYFVDFYRSMTSDLLGLEAREHTAQVQYELRIQREDDFRAAKLPILYCSPTMELGVDISELNVVNMRNVPPTPANYAQRSGRAGRSGQPALVFTYCTVGSPHDQYFFKRPHLMVAGKVAPPRLDLTNEDLVRAHIHAIWLAETGIDLRESLKDILDVAGEPPSLELYPNVRADAESIGARQRASIKAEKLLATIKAELQATDWFSEQWLDETLSQAAARFDSTCERWRDLYRSALHEQEIQNRIIRDATRRAQDKEMAKRVRGLAESQIKLLTEINNVAQSDFYSYRYFASEGFLPGYNFPRLPISAFIPARKTKQQDEFVSRPRFLAISEFGPRSIVYHEGSRYVINKVILPVSDGDLSTHQAKICDRCGYLHPNDQIMRWNICARCQQPLNDSLVSLFKMENVSTRRRDKINSDEEDRLRLGYEIITSVRFNEHSGAPSCRTAEVTVHGKPLVRLAYGQAATLWRVNLGWARRKEKNRQGFVLDIERGYWEKDSAEANDVQDDPMSPRTARVIPFVEDTRNCLLFEPMEPLSEGQMASLQAALKNAIQIRFQLEDNELAAEPLPKPSDRRLLLFYESAEGGAGVLRRLIDNPQALSEVASEALRICHYDQDGTDLRRAPKAKEDCEAACYDCLMSYYNQREHQSLDRRVIRDWLCQLAMAVTELSPTSAPRASHLEALLQQTESELEREWLRYLEARGHRLPSHAQHFIAAAKSRPDFLYHAERVAIYVDGPAHDFPERQARDVQQEEWLEDAGYTVVRFKHNQEWDTRLQDYPNVFGPPQKHH